MDKFCSFESVYSEKQRQLIDGEFRRIKDEHFLDHAGGTLYSEKQMENSTSELKQTLLCNPHGKNAPSQKTEDVIDVLRHRILKHFNTNSETYTVIFTSNATSSLKLIAESFEFNVNGQKGTFTYLEDNHTSVLGMRNYSEISKCVTVQQAFDSLGSTLQNGTKDLMNTNSLFVYPAQCNFSGTKYPLEWIERVQNGRLNDVIGLKSENWYVVLDATNFVGSNHLDLTKYQPDFVPLSFYKIFGYPTGVGTLLVRNCSQKVLRKKYYGGGTVLMTSASENEAVLKTSLPERFEDGTLPYLSIYSLNEGFNTLNRLNLSMEIISQHTFNLARYLYANLATLHHANGKPAVILYHDTTFENSLHQGGIVNFNLIRENGQNIGYAEVMHMASLQKIHVRTGCSCNPGACQRHLGLSWEDVKNHFRAGHVCGDLNDLVDGIPTGSVRASFGYMSKKENVDALLRMIEECFVQKPIIRKLPNNWKETQSNFRNRFIGFRVQTNNTKENFLENVKTIPESICSEDSNLVEGINGEMVRGTLKYILLYPIKSCGAFAAPRSWRICSSGLEYDRKWMIVNKDGSCLSQKQNCNMCLIKPIINIEEETIKLTFPDEDSITLPIKDPNRKTLRQCESKVCRDKVIGYDCGDSVSRWINKCLACQGLRLIQQADQEVARVNKEGQNLQLSFANESQYLMVNHASVKWLRDRVREKEEKYSENLESMILRFRPNIVIDFDTPFLENELDCIHIGNLSFKTVGSCTRCQMICINQVNAQKTKEPLITLAREFGGKVKFGVYLGNAGVDGGNDTIVLGDDVVANRKIRL